MGKVCVQATDNKEVSAQLRLLLTAVTFSVPTPELEFWRRRLHTACKDSVAEELSDKYPPSTHRNATRLLQGLVPHHCCYGNKAYNTGKWPKAPKVAVEMARTMASVLNAIQFTTNLKNRRGHLWHIQRKARKVLQRA